MVKWLPANNFQEEVVLWVQRISDMLGVLDGVTDDPMGSSWSMGVAMLVLFSVEQRFGICSNFPSSCIAELTLCWANGQKCAIALDFNWSHAAWDLAGRACAVNHGAVAPHAALDIHLELQAPCTQQGVPM